MGRRRITEKSLQSVLEPARDDNGYHGFKGRQEGLTQEDVTIPTIDPFATFNNRHSSNLLKENPCGSAPRSAKDGDRYLVMNATKESLEKAPGYTYDRTKGIWVPATKAG